MPWDKLAQLPKEKLLALLQDACKNIIRVDGYYFMEIDKLAGREVALKVDEEVWRRLGRIEAYQLRRAFELEGDGIPTLVQALRLSPIWPLAADYEITQLSDKAALLRVTRCGVQVERVRLGLGVFHCREVDQAYFSSFATTINPRIKVHCLSAPVESYSEDMWCQWRFELDGMAP